MTISHYLPFNVDDLVAKELLDPELPFVRIERVCNDLPDSDCDDGGTVAEDRVMVMLAHPGERPHRCERGRSRSKNKRSARVTRSTRSASSCSCR